MGYTLKSDSPFWLNEISPKYKGLSEGAIFRLLQRVIRKKNISDDFSWRYNVYDKDEPTTISSENIKSFIELLSFLSDAKLTLVSTEKHDILDIMEWLEEQGINDYRLISTSSSNHFVELDEESAVLLKLSLD